MESVRETTLIKKKGDIQKRMTSSTRQDLVIYIRSLVAQEVVEAIASLSETFMS